MVNLRDWPQVPPMLIRVNCVAGRYAQVFIGWSYLHSPG